MKTIVTQVLLLVVILTLGSTIAIRCAPEKGQTIDFSADAGIK